MIRILALLLVLTIGAPASAWAGSTVPYGIDLVGSSCCASEADRDHEPKESQIAKACCCSPDSAAEGSSASQLGPPTSDSLLVPVARVAVTAMPPSAVLQTRTTHASARAPPPPNSLYAQHTLLVI